jgi:endonuclease/exonuclease/phosphatase family metal-dependent hydrolase
MTRLRAAFIRVIVCTLFLGATACASAPVVPGGGLRVMSYNIHAGKDAEQQHNLERVARIIADAGADIVLLQEVDRATRRSGGEDHLAELARLTSMHAAFGKSLDFQGGEYGIAVLSRYPLERPIVVPLAVSPPQDRSGSEHEPRVGLHVVVATPAGPLHIVNTHIDHGGAPTYRHQEVMGLLAHVARHVPADARLILGGDLNARPDTPEIAALSLIFGDAWTRCGDGGAGHTFPAHAPDRRIDYILMRHVGCRDARVIDTQASDHRPVMATITF